MKERQQVWWRSCRWSTLVLLLIVISSLLLICRYPLLGVEALLVPSSLPFHTTTRRSTITTTLASSPFDLAFFKKKKLVPGGAGTEVSIESYQYKNYTLTYRYLPASPGCEKETPILLIHPVGIGLASWYWDKFLKAWKKNEKHPAIYAVNLLGCGVRDGSSPVDISTNNKPASLPVEWAESCERLIRDVILPQKGGPTRFLTAPLQSPGGGCNVVVQGGLAPIGVLLAAGVSGNTASSVVKRLVLTSPPTYKEMTTGIPAQELERNYNFLSSPVWGNLAFRFLESSSAVGFFSNQFLFESSCDDMWVESAMEEACPEVRPPVQVFNAGYCMQESLEDKLVALPQPTLILQGRDDARGGQEEYQRSMKNCILQVLPGKNVLPYESPSITVDAVRQFLDS